jgi:putative FmdB family regulatory protein
MPLFDYRCGACGHQFEALVLKGKEPEHCTSCGAGSLERLLSLPAVKSESTRARSMAAAKRRDTAQAKDQAHEQRKYELSHDD